MKQGLKNAGRIVLILVLVVALLAGGMFFNSQNYEIPDQLAHIDNPTGLVQARGRSLYDAQGNALRLQGINAGQLLLQEGWMSPFALEPLYDEDGKLVKDKDGNLQYPEFSEEEFRAGLSSNPNLQEYDLEELQETYWSCFFTEEDFRIIKEDLGLNTIRLPSTGKTCFRRICPGNRRRKPFGIWTGL